MPPNLNPRALTMLCLTALLAANSAAQTTLLHADFNQCSLPAGWTVNVTGGGAAHWLITDAPSNPNTDGSTIDGTCMAIVDDEMAGQGGLPMTVRFVSPPFDATAHTTVTLDVDIHFQSWGQSQFSVLLFNGSSYILLKRFQQTGPNFSDFTHFTADLSFYANPGMRLVFEYSDGGGQARHSGFDNVKVTGTGMGTNTLLQNFDFCSRPNGWDTEILQGDRDWTFSLLFNDDTDTTSLNGTCFAWFDDDGTGDELQHAPPSRAMLLTPWLDGAQFARYTLDFDVIFQKKQTGERLDVGVWDGAALRIVKTFTNDLGGPFFEDFVHETLDLSYFRAPQFRVAFLYDDGGGWGKWAGLDNVKISGEGDANDLCRTAREIFLHENCAPGGNLTANFSGSLPGCIPPISPTGDDQAAINSVWYRFHAPQDGWACIKTNASFNDAVSVYEGSCSSLGGEICTNRDEFGFSGENLHFMAVAGKDYFIRVSGLRGAFGQELGTLCLELKNVSAPPSLPPNDSCSGALPLEMGGDCVPGSNFNATYSLAGAGMDNKPRADIWYRFVATAPKAEIISHSDFSDIIALYAGICETLSPLATSSSDHQLTVADLEVGVEYFIQISGSFATVEGHCCVEVRPWTPIQPENDHCSQALPLIIGATCAGTSTLGANLGSPKPSCADFLTASTWFSFVAPPCGKVQFNTYADFPTVVALYGGDCGNLVELECYNNPLPCDGYRRTAGLVPGEVYYFQVAANTSFFEGITGGNLCFSLLDGATETNGPLNLQVNVACLGQGVGKLQVHASGGDGNFVFQGTAPDEILYAGDSYLVVVTDGAGCETSMSGIVHCGGAGCPLTAALAVGEVSCPGLSDGSVTVYPQVGTGQLTFDWSNGANGPTITGLPPGPASVTVTDEGGCAVVLSAEVGEPGLLKTQSSASDETAFSANNGTVSTAPEGGTPPYLMQWNNGSTSQAQTGLPPGHYTVTVTDANLCQTTDTVTVAAFTCLLDAAISTQPITCHGGNDGTAQVVPAGGVAPFSFFWSNGQVTPSVAHLPPGLVAVTVTDAAGCPVTLSAEVPQADPLSAQIFTTGNSAASVPAGGLPPFSFFWSNDETTGGISNLEIGDYTVTITDAAGCTATGSTVIQDAGCSVTPVIADLKNITCHGNNDGEATVALSGGTAPLTFSWPGGEATATRTNLAAGTYPVTITDADHCSGVANVTIGEPPPLSGFVLSNTAVPCEEEETGAAVVNGTGGAPPYIYTWPGGSAGPAQTGLAKGTYPVLLADANGCTHIVHVEISVADLLPPVVSVQNLVLELDENGTANLTPADLDNGSYDLCGIAGYHLSKTHFTCDDLGDHLVTLTVTDVNGNENAAVATVTVTDKTPPVLLCPEAIFSNHCGLPLSYDLPVAEGNCLTGPPLLVQGLAPGAVFPLGETLVTYEVASSAGSTAVCSFTVTLENTLAGSMEILPPSCAGSTDGSATVLPIGGAGDFTYQWSVGGQTSPTLSGLGAGIYQVTVTDGAGCAFEAEAFVQGPPLLLIFVENTVAESAPGTADGAISILVSGGVPPYHFEWTNNGQVVSTAEDPDNLAAGQYHVLVTDVYGCQLLSSPILVETLTGTSGTERWGRFVELYPNPTRGLVFVEFMLDEIPQATLVLYDMAGRAVWQKSLAGDQHTLDFTGLPAGVYQLKIIAGERTAVKKVVVVR